MRTPTMGTVHAALLTAGFVALGGAAVFPAAAFADTDGDHSVLGGNQVNVPVSVPVNACGNALALFGTADAACRGGATVRGGGAGGPGGRTSGHHSIGGGNQVTVPVNVPVDVCGNAVAVFGSSAAGCKGGATVKQGGSGAGRQRTSGRNSVLGGNQINIPVKVPVNVCGNSAAVFGEAVAACKGGAKVTPGRPGHPGHGGGSGRGGQRTSGEYSLLGGNQIRVPVNVPVNVCGNAVGNAVAHCKGGAATGGSGAGGGGGRTSGHHSIGGGNQVTVPVNVPVDVCGNAVAVLGDAAAGCKGGSGPGGHGGGYGGGSGNGGGNGGGYGSRTLLGGAAADPADPAVPGLPTVPGVTDGSLPDPAAAPALPKLPAQSQTLAGSRAAAPAAPGQAGPGQVAPGKPPVALPDLPELPVVGDVDVPAMPQGIRPAANAQPLSSGVNDDSLYVLALGGLLAGASAIIGITRRIRFGRR